MHALRPLSPASPAVLRKPDFAYLSHKFRIAMKNLVRAVIAGIGAKKIGGGKCGCIGTIVVFIILYWLLGYVFDAF